MAASATSSSFNFYILFKWKLPDGAGKVLLSARIDSKH
jgi:hypothetical protein